MPYSTTLSIKNRPPQKKPKAAKDGGGVEGRYDRSQRFNGFFLKLPLQVTILSKVSRCLAFSRKLVGNHFYMAK